MFKKIEHAAQVFFNILIGVLVLQLLYSLLDGKRVAYPLRDRYSGPRADLAKADRLPRYIGEAPTSYKFINGKIHSLTSGNARVLNDKECAAYDLNNWQCFYPTGGPNNSYYTYGFENGAYFESVGEQPDYTTESIYVGHLRYIYINCRWLFADGFIQGVFGCPLSFVIIK
jgi:hypothetical protein